MVNEFYSKSVSSDFAGEELRLLLSIVDSARNFISNLDKLESEGRDSIKKMAHLAAINTVKEKAFSVLRRHFIQAIIDSVEYNHYLFVERSLAALETHRNDLIELIASGNKPGSIEVILNMHLLGTIDEYAEAVEATREELNIGKIPNAEIRSAIWQEKIYGVAREGITVTKLKKTKDGGEEEEDVTDRYVGLWEKTIRTRLNYLRPNSAPWWYIINYGNLGLSFPEKSEGTPYPVIEPTYFLDKVKAELEVLFDAYYENALNNTLTDFARAVSDEVEDFTEKYLEAFRKYTPETRSKTLDTIIYNNKVWDLYITSRGKIGLRYSTVNFRR